MCGIEIKNQEFSLPLDENRSSYKIEDQKYGMNPHLHQFSDIPIQDMNILNFLRFEKYYCQIDPLFQKLLREKITNFSAIAKKINTSRETIARITKINDYWMNIETLLQLSEKLGIKKEKVFLNIKYIKTKNSFSLLFNIKNLVSPSFFRILGHILGDGGIHVIEKEKKYRAFYVNNQKELLDSFNEDVKTIFGNIKLYSRERELHGDEIWLPTTVGYILYNIFEYERLNKKKRVPSFVLETKDKKLLGAFLQALYDDEGYLYPQKNMIVIAQTSKELVEEIRKVVLSVGIRPNQLLIHKSKKRTTMYYFSITHKDNIRLFDQYIGFKHPLKKKKLAILIDKYGGK